MDHGIIATASREPLMNANDHVPMVHILPFGLCKKGMPCMPVTPLAWVDVNKKHIIEGAPALTEDSKLACFHGGVITIVPLDAGSAEEGKMNEIVESAVEKIGLALKMAGAIADCIDVFSPGGLVKMAGKKGAAKNLKGGGNKGKGSGGVENKGQASNKSLENRGNNKEESSKAVVKRTGPKGVDPNHHNANVMVRDVDGNVISHERVVSGNMTAQEKALGFPKNALASHTEARAVTQTPLKEGQTMTITGQRPPCPSCKGYMNRAMKETGADIRYQWRQDGTTKKWP